MLEETDHKFCSRTTCKPSSTKSSQKERAPEMHQARKGSESALRSEGVY